MKLFSFEPHQNFIFSWESSGGLVNDFSFASKMDDDNLCIVSGWTCVYIDRTREWPYDGFSLRVPTQCTFIF